MGPSTYLLAQLFLNWGLRTILRGAPGVTLLLTLSTTAPDGLGKQHVITKFVLQAFNVQ